LLPVPCPSTGFLVPWLPLAPLAPRRLPGSLCPGPLLSRSLASYRLPGSLAPHWPTGSLVPCLLPVSLASWPLAFFLAPWLSGSLLLSRSLASYMLPGSLAPHCPTGSLAPCWLPVSLAPWPLAFLLPGSMLTFQLSDTHSLPGTTGSLASHWSYWLPAPCWLSIHGMMLASWVMASCWLPGPIKSMDPSWLPDPMAPDGLPSWPHDTRWLKATRSSIGFMAP